MEIVVPTHYWSSAELLFIRLATSGMVFLMIPRSLPFRNQPFPVGIARFADLTVLSHPRLYVILRNLALVALIFYSSGVMFGVATLYLFGFLVAVQTLVASQGAVNHGRNLLMLVLLAQCFASIWGFLSNFLQLTLGTTSPIPTEQIAVVWSLQTIAASYFISGISKLVNSRGQWISALVAIPPIMIARAEAVLQDGAISKHRRDRSYALAQWLARHRYACKLIFSAALWIEVLSPLALYNRTTEIIGGLLLLLFHVAAGFSMQLQFTWNRFIILIYFINIPYILTKAYFLIKAVH